MAIFRENDVHGASVAFLELAVSNQQELSIPNLALAGIAGVFACQTGKARLATRTLRAVLALPRVQRSDHRSRSTRCLGASPVKRVVVAVFQPYLPGLSWRTRGVRLPLPHSSAESHGHFDLFGRKLEREVGTRHMCGMQARAFQSAGAQVETA